MDIVRRIGEADINRRKILTGAAYCVAAAALPLGLAQAAEAQDRGARTDGRRVGAADIAAVRSMLEAFTVIDVGPEYHSFYHDVSREETVVMKPVPPEQDNLEVFDMRLEQMRSKHRRVFI